MAQNKIFLQSLDGKTFEMGEMAAQQCGVIKNMITDGYVNCNIPVPNITSEACAKIIEYCEHHAAADAISNLEENKTTELNKFDTEFINVDSKLLCELLNAANYLDIKGLVYISSKKAAEMMRNKSVEEIREIFNIKNDFTPEEEQEYRKKYFWAFNK